MDARNLIWIIPITAIMAFIVGVSFVDYDFNITMDDNTRFAIESLNDSLGQVNSIDNYNKVIECQDEKGDLLNEIYDKEQSYVECQFDLIQKDIYQEFYVKEAGDYILNCEANMCTLSKEKIGCHIANGGAIEYNVECPDWMLEGR